MTKNEQTASIMLEAAELLKNDPKSNIKIFLGGTCVGPDYRKDLIPKLNIKYFNPVVDDWTEECQQIEREQRETCDIVLYTITPYMEGVYSICEVTDDSNKRPKKTVLCILEHFGDKSFNKPQMKSLKQVGIMVSSNGGQVFYNLNDVAKYCNNFKKEVINNGIESYTDIIWNGCKCNS